MWYGRGGRLGYRDVEVVGGVVVWEGRGGEGEREEEVDDDGCLFRTYSNLDITCSQKPPPTSSLPSPLPSPLPDWALSSE